MPSYESIVNSQPHLFAEYYSGGIWKPFKWLAYISDVITEAIIKGGGRIIVNVPPQHGKSNFISQWVPLWYLNNWPENNVGLITYEAEYARYWSRRCKDEILYNDKISLSLKKDAKSSKFWQLEQGGGMFAAGIGGPLTGKSIHLGIIDDPVKNWDEAKSPTYQQRNIDWFDTVFYTRAQPNTTFIVLMTRWHEADLCGYLINEHSDDWTVLKLPAISEETNDLLGREIGEALCPERFGVEDLEKKKKALGSMHFAGLYQQRPSAAEGGIIKRDWIEYYKVLPESFHETIQSWDLSFKDTTDGSFVVGQVWARNGANFYLLDQVRSRMDFPSTKSAIIRLSKRYPEARKKVVEDKANGPAIVSDLKKKVPGLVSFSAKDSKEARLSAVSPYFESGNVFLPDPSIKDWVKDLVEELVNFPNALHDDQVDACSQALTSFKVGSSVMPSGTGSAYDKYGSEIF